MSFHGRRMWQLLQRYASGVVLQLLARNFVFRRLLLEQLSSPTGGQMERS